MRIKSNLIFPALIIVAIYCMQAKSAAPLVSDSGLPRKDLSLLEQRHQIREQITFDPGNTISAGFVMFDPVSVGIDITEAMVAAKRQVLKISTAGQRPVICELRSPSRIVVKSSQDGQRMHRPANDFRTFSGGVKVEVFVGEKLILDLTGEEVTVEQ